MLLRFGVLDIPYQKTEAGKPRSAKAAVAAAKRNKPVAPRSGTATGMTTGDVAEILEAKYHVFEHFWEMHQDAIGDAVGQCLEDFFADRLAGSRANRVDFLSAESTIKTLFQTFIDARQMDSLGYPGIPTAAAKKGVNHRLRHPYAKGNPERPSFRDTGLYMQSFMAVIEE